MNAQCIKMMLLVLGLTVTAALSGCSEVNLESNWRSKPIALDGSIAGWPEDVQYFDEKSKTLLSIVNDADDLYIRIVTRSETSKRLIFGKGFTVTIDDPGSNDNKFGIRFPLARQNRIPGSIADHKPRTGIEDKLADSRYNLAILRGSEGKRQTMPVQQAHASGIYTSLSMQQGILVYELKVPLPRVSADKIVAIGFQSGKPDRSSGGGGSRGGKGGGRGGGGHGGGNGGGGRGKGGQHGGSQAQAVEILARVHLAVPPGAQEPNLQ